MDLDKRTVIQIKRLGLTFAIGLVVSVLLGMLTGWLRSLFDSIVILWVACFIVAYVVRKVGRGIQLSYAVLSLVLAAIMMFLSDVVLAAGVSGLLDFNNYSVIFNLMFVDDIQNVFWLLYRAMGLFIAFNYARVV